jgi:hypothetical protein
VCRDGELGGRRSPGNEATTAWLGDGDLSALGVGIEQAVVRPRLDHLVLHSSSLSPTFLALADLEIGGSSTFVALEGMEGMARLPARRMRRRWQR